MNLFKCSACNYIYESEEVLEKCPMCGAPKEKMVMLSEEQAEKIYNADMTNDIHSEIVELASKIIGLCELGVEEDLDPMCVKIFTQSNELAWQIKQMSKAEIENHVRKEKW